MWGAKSKWDSRLQVAFGQGKGGSRCQQPMKTWEGGARSCSDGRMAGPKGIRARTPGMAGLKCCSGWTT